MPVDLPYMNKTPSIEMPCSSHSHLNPPPGKSDEADRVQMGGIIQWFSCELHAWPACGNEVPTLSTVLLKLSAGVSLLLAVHLCSTVSSPCSSATSWWLTAAVSLSNSFYRVLWAHHCFSDVHDPTCPSKTSSCYLSFHKAMQQFCLLMKPSGVIPHYLLTLNVLVICAQ